jgi:hypothetical protein
MLSISNSWSLSRKEKNKMIHMINGNTDGVAGYLPYDATKHMGFRKSIIFKLLQKKKKIIFDCDFSFLFQVEVKQNGTTISFKNA